MAVSETPAVFCGNCFWNGGNFGLETKMAPEINMALPQIEPSNNVIFKAHVVFLHEHETDSPS